MHERERPLCDVLNLKVIPRGSDTLVGVWGGGMQS